MNRIWTPMLLGMAILAANAQNQPDLSDRELAEYLGVQADFVAFLEEIPLEMGGNGPTAPRIVQFLAGHAGDNRYLFRIVLAEDLSDHDTVFHFYADLDDDPETGRQDSAAFQGTDMMYSFVEARNDPRFMNRDVRVSNRIPVRGVARGNEIYVCDDIRPKIVDGRAQFRVRFLCHLRSSTGDNYRSDWTAVSLPLAADRTPPRLPMPEAQGFSTLTMPNFAELSYHVWQSEGTIRLRPETAASSGYTLLMNDDFAGLGEAGERVAWPAPVAGDYHIGLVMQPNPSRLRQQRRLEAGTAGAMAGLDVLVDGERVGTAATHPTAPGEVIHYTTTPVRLREGAAIEVRSAEYSGPVVFHSVHLTRRPPQVPPLHIERLSAWHIPDHPGEKTGRIMVAWTTNRPTEADIRYRATAGAASEGRMAGRGRVNNHLITLPGDLPGDAWELAILCREADQDDFEAQTAQATYTVHRDRLAHLRAHGIEPTLDPHVVRIPLSVYEPTGNGRSHWPLRSGIPLPQGLLQDPVAVRLLDTNGADVPVQTQALSRWPDGLNVQWLLVDFMARTTAGENAAYTLVLNEKPAAQIPPSLRIEAQADEAAGVLGQVAVPVTVHTGPLTLRLGEQGFRPFADVLVEGRRQPTGTGGFELTDAEGVVFSSAREAPESIVVEADGPLRATVAVRGRLLDAESNAYMRYLCRLHFHAGSAAVRTVFTLENDVFQPDMNLLASLHADIPANLAGASVSVGGDGEPHALAAGGRILQDEDFRYVGSLEGRRADGWLLASGTTQPVAVAVRDFWQLYPKAFRLGENAIRVELLPELPADQYAGANDDELTQWYFWNERGRYKIRTGVRLSTEFAVDWAPAIQPGSPAGYAAAEWWQQPLFAACTPEWYCATGVLDTMLPRQEGNFDIYEQRLDTAFARFRDRQESQREYGFMNYGDWFGERRWNWGNVEYDTQWALAAHFLRTGNLHMLHHAQAAALHNADIDTIHHHPDPNRVGQVYTHATGHTAGYFPRDWKDMGGFNVLGGNRGGHIWAQGQYALHALTGDERLRESADKIADMLAHHTTDFRYGAERTVGWPMVSVLAGYDFSANPFHLNAAHLMADIVVWSQHPERGLWGHWIDGNECDHAPRCWGSKPFMTGVLLRAMKMHHLATGRDDVLGSMAKSVDFLFREAYVADGDRPGFHYSSCRHQRYSGVGSVSRLNLIGPGLAYVALLDPHPQRLARLEEVARLYFERAGLSDFGKSFTQATCFMGTTMHDLARLGIHDFPAPPPLPVVPPPPPGAALRRATEFVAQDGGQVQTRTAREKPGTGGESISHWDDQGHSLTWEITATATGNFRLLLRYCAAGEARRRIQVGDRAPIEQLFPATGGFGAQPHEWHHAQILDRGGQPLTLAVTQGQTIRITMTNLDGRGMNLEYLALVP